MMLPWKKRLRPSRVLLVSHGADFRGGAEIGFRDVIIALGEKFPELDLVAVYPANGEMAEDAVRRGVRTLIAHLPWWVYVGQQSVFALQKQRFRLFAATLQAVYLIARIRPTMVITNTIAPPPFAFAAKLFGIPHIWMIREFGRQDHGFGFLLGYRRSIRLIGSLSEIVICNTRAIEQVMGAVAPGMETRVVYPAIDSGPVTPSARPAHSPFRAVLVGAMIPAKGQQIALKSVAAARSAGVDVHLDLVGGGDNSNLRELSLVLGIQDLVSFHDHTSEVARHLSGAHVGLMCSVCEAFGRVTVEAMAAGLPVCGTDSGGTPELIVPEVNGLLSPPGDWNALAANLVRLASDEDLRLKLSSGAIRTARGFRRERFNDELAAVFSGVLKRGSTALKAGRQ